MMEDSLVFWGQQAWKFKDKAVHHRYPTLSNLDLSFYGVRGLKIQWIPSLLQEKIDENGTPDILLIHCGTNNINPELNLSETSQTVSDVLVEVFKIQKKAEKPFKIIWSDILPWYNYKGMVKEKGLILTTNINAVAQFIMHISGHLFLQYPYFDPSQTKFFRMSKGELNPVHLSQLGYRVWFSNMDQFLSKYYPTSPLLEVDPPPPPIQKTPRVNGKYNPREENIFQIRASPKQT